MYVGHNFNEIPKPKFMRSAPSRRQYSWGGDAEIMQQEKHFSLDCKCLRLKDCRLIDQSDADGSCERHGCNKKQSVARRSHFNDRHVLKSWQKLFGIGFQNCLPNDLGSSSKEAACCRRDPNIILLEELIAKWWLRFAQIKLSPNTWTFFNRRPRRLVNGIFQ